MMQEWFKSQISGALAPAFSLSFPWPRSVANAPPATRRRIRPRVAGASATVCTLRKVLASFSPDSGSDARAEGGDTLLAMIFDRSGATGGNGGES
eukprot:scaffold2311_cov187-Pinguiococcus_pyrenoidosus.AAC.1